MSTQNFVTSKQGQGYERFRSFTECFDCSLFNIKNILWGYFKNLFKIF